jgi:alpha-mannosidase
VREGCDLNVPVTTAAGGSGTRSLVTVDAAGIVLETVKAPEAGDADALVLRLYESLRTRTRCTVRIDLPVAKVLETDLRERTLQELHAKDGAVQIDFRPFEIKTLLVKLGPARGGTKKAGPGRAATAGAVVAKRRASARGVRS